MLFCLVYVALPKQCIKQFKPVQQSRKHALKAYCHNIYTEPSGDAVEQVTLLLYFILICINAQCKPFFKSRIMNLNLRSRKLKFIGSQIVEEVMSLASHPVTGYLIMTNAEYYVIG